MVGIWIALGGGLGSLARYGLAGLLMPWSQAGLPWGTFAVNVAGSTLLGFLVVALPAPIVSTRARGFFTIGFCGGLTTFSAFDVETLTLLQANRYGAAAAYSAGTVAACLAGVLVGLSLARLLNIYLTGTRSTPPRPAPPPRPPTP